jgi:hypothetical protein
MNTSIFHKANSMIILRFTLTRNDAIISNYSANNNTTQSSYIVYTKGSIQYSNIDGSFTLTRTVGDTTDTSEAYSIPVHLAMETNDAEAEFFCISKFNQMPVTRTSYQLDTNQEHLSTTDTIFLANGTVTVNSSEFTAPAVIETSAGTNILATQSSWIIELS